MKTPTSYVVHNLYGQGFFSLFLTPSSCATWLPYPLELKQAAIFCEEHVAEHTASPLKFFLSSLKCFKAHMNFIQQYISYISSTHLFPFLSHYFPFPGLLPIPFSIFPSPSLLHSHLLPPPFPFPIISFFLSSLSPLSPHSPPQRPNPNQSNKNQSTHLYA